MSGAAEGFPGFFEAESEKDARRLEAVRGLAVGVLAVHDGDEVADDGSATLRLFEDDALVALKGVYGDVLRIYIPLLMDGFNQVF